MSSYGMEDENGYYVKAQKSGEPWPKDSKLAPIFRAAGVDTVPAVLKYAAGKYSGKQCMATRMLLSRHHEDVGGKLIEKLHLGEYFWRTYSQVQESAEAVGCSMVELNVEPNGRVCMFAETRDDWFTAAMGCLQQRISICTIYTTLNDESVVHIINETEVNVVFVSFDLLQRFIKLLDKTPHVTTLVVMEDQLEGMGDVSLIRKNISVIPFSRIAAKENIVHHHALERKPQPEDTAIIMYTSGSTGTPKGVELTHSNIVTSIIAFSCQMNMSSNDRYLAFNPLAHIMEFACEVSLISLGITIYYSSPYTITSKSSKIKEGTDGDAKLARPTMITSVPLILDRIIKGVSLAVEEQGWLKSSVFNLLVAYKAQFEVFPFISALLDKLVFQKVRNELGGNLKKVAVGGAPLSPQTHLNFKAIFGCTLQVGYGSTETACCSTGMSDDDNRTGVAGAPCLNILLKLIDWEEGNYKTTDKPFPRGEILIGGPCVAKGYYNLPKETSESFIEEDGVRWFKSGDIGEIDDSGCLKIIDRKKDLVKLRHGEYISLGHTESIIKTHGVIDNMCIFADSTKNNTVAVVVPVQSVLEKLAMNNDITETNMSLGELCADKRVIAAVLKELQLHARRCGLSRWEIPAALHLSKELWTPDTGLVTAAFKLRRQQLNQQYRTMVLDMYSRLDA